MFCIVGDFRTVGVDSTLRSSLFIVRCGHLISRCLPPHILHESSTSLSLDEDDELGEPPPSSFLVRSKTGKEGGKTLAPGCGGGGCVDDAATFAAGLGYPAGIGAHAQGFGHTLGTSVDRPGGGVGAMRNGIGTPCSGGEGTVSYTHLTLPTTPYV